MTDCKHLVQQRIKTSEQNAAVAQCDSDIRLEIGPHQCDILRSGSQWNLVL